jgi:DNA-binding MarR family transcriptional regulator
MAATHDDRTAAAVTALILAVFRLNGGLIGAGDELVRDLGLTSARWQVLGALALGDTPLTAADTARAMGLTRQSVQRLSNELLAAGLLARLPNPRHATAPLLGLTERGRRTYDAAARRQAPWARRLGEGLGIGALTRAADVVRGIADRLDQQRGRGAAARGREGTGKRRSSARGKAR